MKKSLFFLENCLQATVTAKNIPLGQSRNITQYADEATVLYWVWATVGGMVGLIFLLILIIFIRRTLALQKLEIESKHTEQYQNLLAQWLVSMSH